MCLLIFVEKPQISKKHFFDLKHTLQLVCLVMVSDKVDPMLWCIEA